MHLISRNKEEKSLSSWYILIFFIMSLIGGGWIAAFIWQICVNVPLILSDTLKDRGTSPLQFGQSLKKCVFFVRWLFGISIWISGASGKDWVVSSVQRAVWLASVWRKIGGNKISTQPLSIWSALTEWVLFCTIGHLVPVNNQQFNINQIIILYSESPLWNPIFILKVAGCSM